MGHYLCWFVRRQNSFILRAWQPSTLPHFINVKKLSFTAKFGRCRDDIDWQTSNSRRWWQVQLECAVSGGAKRDWWPNQCWRASSKNILVPIWRILKFCAFPKSLSGLRRLWTWCILLRDLAFTSKLFSRMNNHEREKFACDFMLVFKESLSGTRLADRNCYSIRGDSYGTSGSVNDTELWCTQREKSKKKVSCRNRHS